MLRLLPRQPVLGIGDNLLSCQSTDFCDLHMRRPVMADPGNPSASPTYFQSRSVSPYPRREVWIVMDGYLKTEYISCIHSESLSFFIVVIT